MPKLHQLLAVEPNLKGQMQKVLMSTKHLLSGKSHHFSETHSEFQPTDENMTREVVEAKSLQTTVFKEIDFVIAHMVKAMDNAFQIDEGNTKARADIELNGRIVLKGVPATTLLQLEHRLEEVKSLIDNIPTLDPAKGFLPDPDRGMGIYKAREVRKQRMMMKSQVIVLVPVTDKHPGQSVVKDMQMPVGHIIEQEWSSLITPAKKAELFDSAEEVLRAVKDARSRANDIPVESPNKIGETLLELIFKPLSTA